MLHSLQHVVSILTSLTHLFHEFLIVIIAIHFPGAVESHGGREGELDNSAARSVLLQLCRPF